MIILIFFTKKFSYSQPAYQNNNIFRNSNVQYTHNTSNLDNTYKLISSQASTTQIINVDISQLLQLAKNLISEGKLQEAKEILKTIIIINPYNLDAWNLYDNVVESLYISREREEKRNPVIEKDLKPTFSILNVETYEEYNTLYVIGHIKNLSSEPRYNIVLEAALLDENKQPIKKELGTLNIRGRALFSGETAMFEIPIKNPPPGIKSYKVRVVNFE